MQFTDFTFLFGFFPLSWLLYQAVPKRFKNPLLFALSIFFYGWGSIRALVILAFVVCWNYIGAKDIERTQKPGARKRKLWSAILVDVALLGLYKYLLFWLADFSSAFGLGWNVPILNIPLGLSFYLFSSISALVDVYRNRRPVCGFIEFGIFCALFAWVNMGPIAHYDVLYDQLKRHRVTAGKLRNGAALFIQGLVFKVVFADNLASLYMDMSQNLSLLGSWVCIIAYFLQLYFDFCGYSRMARGTASFFGFTVPENFNHPYRALSINDYWRRWHISLTSWFRNYVYIPLGGNRVSKARWIFNIFVVWILTGFWHGASSGYLAWGILEAVLILAERSIPDRILERIPKLLRHGYVLLSQLLADTFFCSVSAAAGLGMIGRYFGIGISALADPAALFAFYENIVLLALGIFVCSSAFERVRLWLMEKTKSSYTMVCTAGYAFAFLVCISFLVSQSAQVFLYANF